MSHKAFSQILRALFCLPTPSAFTVLMPNMPVWPIGSPYPQSLCPEKEIARGRSWGMCVITPLQHIIIMLGKLLICWEENVLRLFNAILLCCCCCSHQGWPAITVVWVRRPFLSHHLTSHQDATTASRPRNQSSVIPGQPG